MPIIIEYINGQRDAVEGESWKQLDEATPRLGQIYLKDLNDGHRIIVNKSNWVRVHEIAEDVWKANQEAQRNGQEDQAKKNETAKQERDAKVAVNAAWRKKFALVRLFSKKPFPEVA